MLRKILISLSFTILAHSALAHEVWLERDADTPSSVRIYLGEPGEPDSGEDIAKLEFADVFTNDRHQTATLRPHSNHWTADITGTGDVRLSTDKIWQPWSMGKPSWWEFWKDEKIQGAILQAKAGRTESTAKLPFELVPVTANGDTFKAMFKGTSLTNQTITLLSPAGTESEISTNQNGEAKVALAEKGRYLLSSIHSIDTQATHSQQQVDSLMYISSLTFVVE